MGKVSQLTAETVLTDDDLLYLVNDPGGTPASRKITAANARPYLGISPANTQTVSYTLVLADQGKTVEVNAAAANTWTVPPNSTAAFPVGSIVAGVQLGAGLTTVTAGAGVTLRSRGGALISAGQYACWSAWKRATDEWVVTGDLV